MKKTPILLMIFVMMISCAFAADTLPYLKSTLLNQVPDPVEPGSYVDVRFQIENTGGVAENVVFNLEPEYPFSFYPGETGDRQLGDINMRQTGNDSYILYYRIQVDKDATEGDFPLRLKYSIKGGSFVSLEPYNIRVRSTNATLLYISSVQSEPNVIMQGQISKISFDLNNMASALLKNVKVKLSTGTDSPISPVGTSDEVVFQNIAASGKKEAIFNVIASPSTESGVYKVPVDISYIDSRGSSHTKQQYISIQIGDEPNILLQLDESTIKSTGSKGKISIKIVNRGLEDVKFLTVKLDDSELYDKLGTDEEYVGNIESDDYETTEFEIFLKSDASSEAPIPLRLTYMDSLNREYEESLNIVLKTFSQEELKRYGTGTEGNSKTVGVIIVLAVVVIGLLIFFRIRKKNRQKKLD